MSAIDVITYTALRENLAKVMDEVCDAGSHVVVTRQNARPVVVMSYEEFRSWEETLHLLRSPANAERLHAAAAELDAGQGTERDPIEPPEAAPHAARPARRRPRGP
ncbi:MAG TPA: type II toxin-antitoxin system prevent-host-death family antitoxin [Microvirga sp.]|jgi:antitoxin YefM|nr:type II toxin-antitoxin system prevent-host-death family antitoxin [Microvirga sp.]